MGTTHFLIYKCRKHFIVNTIVNSINIRDKYLVEIEQLNPCSHQCLNELKSHVGSKHRELHYIIDKISKQNPVLHFK